MRIGTKKDSKAKPEESTHLTYTGLCHSSCSQRLPGCVERTDALVNMRERGGGQLGSCVLRNAKLKLRNLHAFRKPLFIFEKDAKTFFLYFRLPSIPLPMRHICAFTL